jgi:hypothetical protein
MLYASAAKELSRPDIRRNLSDKPGPSIRAVSAFAKVS